MLIVATLDLETQRDASSDYLNDLYERVKSKAMSEEKQQDANDEGEDEDDHDLKVILLGDSAVGKSKLVERYLMEDYNPRQVRERGEAGAATQKGRA